MRGPRPVLTAPRVSDAELWDLLLNSRDTLKLYIAERIPEELREAINIDDVLLETWTSGFSRSPYLLRSDLGHWQRWLRPLADQALLAAIHAGRQVHISVQLQAINTGGLKTSYWRLFQVVGPHHAGPEHEMRVDDAVQWVRRAVNELDSASRDAIWMRFIEGRRLDDMERRLQTPKPVLEVLLFNGLRKLREQISSANVFNGESGMRR